VPRRSSDEIDQIIQRVIRAANGEPPEPNGTAPLNLKVKALRLRAAGYSYGAISRAVNRSHGTVKKWVDAELEAHVSPIVDEMRRLETVRLEMLLETLQPGIARGDDKAINAAIRVSEQISKLWGLHMPIKVDANIYEQTEQDRELAELIAMARAQAALSEDRVVRAASEDPDL